MKILQKKEIIESVNNKIIDIISNSNSSDLSEIGTFVVNSGGKRIRALLHYLIGSLMNVEHDKLITVGSICEIIHTATLLHDDVIDKSLLRRKNKTANVLWGNRKCILTGDFLLARGLRELVKINITPLYLIFSTTIEDLVSGEILEMNSHKKLFLSEKEYYQIIQCKTASLFSCSVKSASILASSEYQIDHIDTFGQNLGQLFQIRDDFIDYFCESTDSGKARFSDLKNCTMTLPLIKLVSKANKDEMEFITNLMSVNSISDNDCSSVIEMMNNHNIGDEIISIIYNLINESKKFLDSFPKSSIKDEILKLTEELIVANNLSNYFSKISN